MKPAPKPILISIIIPVYNEEPNILDIHDRLQTVFADLPNYRYEMIFVDDGSIDESEEAVETLEKHDNQVRLIRLARNFGKEIATTAGLHKAKGEAAILIDADLQHPPEVIPEFLRVWEDGFDVVIGVRNGLNRGTILKRLTSSGFYKLINRISMIEIIPHATDFRLLDKVVINEFNRFTERNRMTRGLIDWLGFNRAYVEFTPAKRLHGTATYTYSALTRLAFNTIVSLSFFPLRIAGYLGVIIILVSGPLGLAGFIEQYILHDPLNIGVSGTAMLAFLTLFMVGIILVCLGLIALYIANIYGEVVNRPMYVEKRRPSRQ